MKTAYIVAGLAYGDEGKGATVDFLTRRYDARLVVRYNGGSQAGHNVVLSDGRSHTFAQFGSGTFVPGVATHLSRFMLVNPLNMAIEEEHLSKLSVKDSYDRLTVEEECLIITPFQQIANRLLEKSRGVAKHGTCGQGIGQCRSDHLQYGEQVLFAGDLKDKEKTKSKLRFLQQKSREVVDSIGFAHSDLESEEAVEKYAGLLCAWPARIVGSGYLKYRLKETECTIFEGAQGVLLDEIHGTAPHNTWTDTTFGNALRLLQGFGGKIHRIGVLRTYFTRHGEGPFPTENREWQFPEPHNNGGGFQGKFRVGGFDWVSLRYALKACGGVDVLALNHLDQKELSVDALERFAGAKVFVQGFGPTAQDKKLASISCGVLQC